ILPATTAHRAVSRRRVRDEREHLPGTSGPERRGTRVAAERGEYRRDDAGCIEAGERVLMLRLVMVDEAVGHGERPHLEAAVERPRGREVVENVAAEAPDSSLLDRDQHLVLSR